MPLIQRIFPIATKRLSCRPSSLYLHVTIYSTLVPPVNKTVAQSPLGEEEQE